VGGFVIRLETVLRIDRNTQLCTWKGDRIPPENGVCIYDCEKSGTTYIPPAEGADPCPQIRLSVPVPPNEGPPVCGPPRQILEPAKPAPPRPLPEPAKPAPPRPLPEPAKVATPPPYGPAKASATYFLKEMAVRACSAPADIGQWVNDPKYRWLPTREPEADDRSAELSGCEKDLFLDLLGWNASGQPPSLDTSWFQAHMRVPAPASRCGQECSPIAPPGGIEHASSRELDDWCVQACGCNGGWDTAKRQCVP
jgi:hypothetical protein